MNFTHNQEGMYLETEENNNGNFMYVYLGRDLIMSSRTKSMEL
jgi:hypothetical protein